MNTTIFTPIKRGFQLSSLKEWFESNHSISQRLKYQKAENKSSEWWNLSVLLTHHLHTVSVLTDGWMVCTWYGCFFMVFPPHMLKKKDYLALIALEYAEYQNTGQNYTVIAVFSDRDFWFAQYPLHSITQRIKWVSKAPTLHVDTQGRSDGWAQLCTFPAHCYLG